MSGSAGPEDKIKRMLALLLTEDDEDLRKTLGLFLSSQGFRVFQAGSGEEAIEVVQRNKISFSIMDVNLPGLSGIEAFRLISREVGHMPCIFMSGDTSPETMLQALSAGGFTFLSKPIQIDLMRHSVDRLINKFFGGRDIKRA